MRAIALFICLLFLSFGSLSAQDSSPKLPAVTVPNTEIVTLTSKINDQDYWLSIALPDSYDESKDSYPVLYLLDPSYSFLSVTEFVRFTAFTSTFPELIVVGIGYPPDADVIKSRMLDYARPDDLLKIVGDEVVPLIDSSYRTNTSDRAFVGWVEGGDVVFHAFVSRIELFNRYIAINPTGSELMPYLMRNDKAFRSQFVGRDIKLFTSAQGTEVLSLALKKRAYDGLTVFGLSLGAEVREPALHLSLPAGILAIYCGESPCTRSTNMFD